MRTLSKPYMTLQLSAWCLTPALPSPSPQPHPPAWTPWRSRGRRKPYHTLISPSGCIPLLMATDGVCADIVYADLSLASTHTRARARPP